MTFLQIYLYANISILFFWMFYRIFLRNVKHFQAGRFYILSALPGSLAIPFLQNGISGFIKSHETIVNSSLYNFIYLTTTNGYSGEQILNPIFSIDFLSVVKTFILIGAIASSAWIILSHIRINQLIKRSRLLNSDQTRILLSKENFVPFIYNNSILIPDSVPPSDRDIIIRHESLHYKLGHHYDNYLFQLFQIIFWANPLIYLLKRELSQLHEYQVDNLVVSSGIDPVEYNFILIRFRAGMQKFAIANGLKNSRIKKRIIMINTRISKKGNWKYFLLIPAICILLLSLSFSSIKPEKADNIPLPAVESVQEKDSVKIKLITLPEDFIIQNNKNIAIVPKDLESVILVLMNKISDVAINGKFAPEGKRVSMLIREYEKSREDRFFQNQSPKVKIITQKDMNAVEEDYKALLDEISTAIYTMHESWAKELYNKPFNELNDKEQAKILEIIPPKIYQASPKKIQPPPPKR